MAEYKQPKSLLFIKAKRRVAKIQWVLISIFEWAEERNYQLEERLAYPVWGTEQKHNKEQWAESRPVEHHKADQSTHNRAPEINKKRSTNNIWKNNGQYFPNLMKNINLYIVEAQQTPRRINTN